MPGSIVDKLTTASLHGQVFEDLDADGVKDSGEDRGGFGWPVWTVYLDANNNGQLDGGETRALTVAGGQYAFTGLAPGTYVVRVVPQPQNDWYRTTADATVTLSADQRLPPQMRDFGAYRLGSLSGRVTWDLDRDGLADSWESGLAGRTVYLDRNNNTAHEPGRQQTVAAADTPKVLADGTRTAGPPGR